MSAQLLLAAALALAVLLAWARLVRWQAVAPPEARSPTWRLVALLAAQPICALLLYLTLVPPTVRIPKGTLVVATRGTGALAAAAADRAVALPEASALSGVERVPDLGTALRRYPDTRRIRVIGEGLPPRDRDAARGLALGFEPGDAPAGIVRLDPPARVAPGAAFRVGGRVAGYKGGSIELLDPAGGVVDRRPLDADGGFALRGSARAPGAALFRLRVRGAGRRVVEGAVVPVVTADDAPPRVLLLAGAPGPEPKFLRRWATDAGLDLHAQFPTGGGIALGDDPLPINASTLRRFDLAILDDRSWAALSRGERGALIGAVRGGLGLLLRVTGAVPDATRQQWRALGFTVAGGADVAEVRLVANPDDHDLTRRAVRIMAPDDVPLLRDAAGQVLASWRAEGRGRVALWPLTDSYVLALAGAAADYAELWSDAFSALARARAVPPPAIDAVPRVQMRMTICGLRPNATVASPGGGVTRLVVESPASCAAFWPTQAGWHLLRDPREATTRTSPYYVQAADALPGVRALEAREATLRLIAEGGTDAAVTATRERPGPSWPWFLAWLAASAALWWFERTRTGGRAAMSDATPR